MHEMWLERWQEGRTGWHEDTGNKSLMRHWRVTGRRVLVPLCGKTPDIRWLADHGNQVIGVELSALAVEAFFEEQALTYSRRSDEPRIYESSDQSITIFCGDYFELQLPRCDAHYDRAALIAMPAELRPAYAARTSALLEPAAEQLVITLEYDQSVADGPPFSVPERELVRYWPDLVCVDSRDDIENGPPKFIEAGLSELRQKVWRSP